MGRRSDPNGTPGSLLSCSRAKSGGVGMPKGRKSVSKSDQIEILNQKSERRENYPKQIATKVRFRIKC